MSSRIPTPVRATLIHNPTAGDASVSASDLRQMIESAGFQVRYESTKKAWKKALRAPADLVVAAGGDGTVAKVLRQMAGRSTPVAILPLGTANNIARSLGVVGRDARRMVRSWKRAGHQPFDIGVVRNGQRRELFVESCGGGVFASAIARGRREVESPTRYMGDEPDRALMLTRDLMKAARTVHWQVELDGRDVSGKYVGVEIMNVRFAGAGVPLAPDALPGDGWLDVVLVGDAERQALVDHITDRVTDAAAAQPGVAVRRARSVRLGNVHRRLHIDDRLAVFRDAGRDPHIDLELMAGACQVVVPNVDD